MKLTPSDLIFALKVRRIRHMKELIWFYSPAISERTVYRVLKLARKQGLIKTDRSVWPYEYYSTI